MPPKKFLELTFLTGRVTVKLIHTLQYFKFMLLKISLIISNVKMTKITIKIFFKTLILNKINLK